MSYYEKYLKYKNKYVQLKNAVGAGDVSAIIKLTNADGKAVNPIKAYGNVDLHNYFPDNATGKTSVSLGKFSITKIEGDASTCTGEDKTNCKFNVMLNKDKKSCTYNKPENRFDCSDLK